MRMSGVAARRRDLGRRLGLGPEFDAGALSTVSQIARVASQAIVPTAYKFEGS